MTTSKGWRGNFFEDFELGMSVPCPTPRTLGSGEVAAYIAMTGDRTARFCNGTGRIHPLLVFHQVLGQTVRHISLNAVANLGYAQLLWHRPVYAGTTIHTEAEVIGLKENSSGRAGIVWVRTTGRDETGNALLSYVRWVMVRKQGTDSTRWRDAPVIPELESSVPTDTLSLDALEPLPLPRETGANWVFGDYQVGERVFHMDGHTVNPTDHMAFTRSFQNSARVHFDALQTEGDPLVFGGFAMSIGYAQAHNGFENRLGMAAINGGTHANPVHAGDTLYSMTEVLGVDPMGEASVGAIRCRLAVFKNENPADIPDVQLKEDGRHRASVVLDLDFWELVPKGAHPSG